MTILWPGAEAADDLNIDKGVASHCLALYCARLALRYSLFHLSGTLLINTFTYFYFIPIEGYLTFMRDERGIRRDFLAWEK